MLIEKIARLWSANDNLPPHVDVIVLVSFGATKNGLTKGTKATLEKTLELVKQYPEARVAFGVFTLSPRPGVEERIKKLTFKNPIFADTIVSTIEEAEKIRAALPSELIIRSIVVVTDEWHSRSAKTVWTRVWRDKTPRPNIRIISISSSLTIDGDNPMIALRKHWTWALVNVLRQIFLICVPGSFHLMKKFNFHQPTD